MKTALLIRSSGSADRLKFFLDKIRTQRTADVFIVLDCTVDAEKRMAAIREVAPDIRIIPLTREFITESGLAYFSRVTWQCGDYFYYAAFSAIPGYDFYWLVDDDVCFNLDADAMFLKSEQCPADVMGMELGPRQPYWSWHKSIAREYPDRVYGMLYPLSRLSSRAVAFLFEKRRAYDSGLDPALYEKTRDAIYLHANDEAFTVSTLANNGFSTQSIGQLFKAEFSGFFSTERPVLYEETAFAYTQGKVIHPVTDCERAKAKFGIIYRKYGPEKMMGRAERIAESCGEETWNKCFDKTISQLRDEVNSRRAPEAKTEVSGAAKPSRRCGMSRNDIKLFWWRGGKDGSSVNVGDEINGRVVESISGRRVIRSRLADADLLAIGSVLHFPQREKVLAARKTPYLVWGSGTLNATPVESQDKFVLSAVRGGLTNSLFGNRRDVTFGDPGLFASRIWETNGKKTAKWGLIPHHSQLSRPWVQKFAENSERCKVIDVTNPDIDATLAQIASCDFIASTSLHGLIFADSYKIPSVWLWDGALHSGGSWKFFDYFSGVERNLSDNVAVNRISNLDEIDMTTKSFSHFAKIDMICNRLLLSIPV